MSWVPVPVRRLAMTLIALVAVVGPSLITMWLFTPSADDVQQRVRARTDSLGVVLLREDEVPPLLAKGVVATEDERFYSHHGIDSIGLGRAVLYDITHLCFCEGGSTITEQLVKDVYLGGSAGGYNKVKELVLALKVEREISKGQIMADYLSDHHRSQPVRGDRGGLRLLPGTPKEPHAWSVRPARGRHAGAIAVRPGRLTLKRPRRPEATCWLVAVYVSAAVSLTG